MKISKLFHWLYTILMLLPFVALIFNMLRIGLNGSMPITSFSDVIGLIQFPNLAYGGSLTNTIREVYLYLVVNLFGIPLTGSVLSASIIINALTYWTDISIIYLIFDVVMYVPLLVHRWIDKAVID